MFFLWMFGERVEHALGHLLTFLCYLACGACGMWLHYLVGPHSTIPCIGASGAVSGMVGTYMVLFPTAQMDLQFYLLRFPVGAVRTSAVVAVLAWFGDQAVLGFIAGVTGWRFGIAFMAHVGGLLAGAALSFAITLLGISQEYRRMIARKAARCVRCPACGTELPWLSPGLHNCWPCGATFRVDEQGDAVVSDPAKPKALAWLALIIFLLVIVGRAQMSFSPWRTWR
jgi:hypothetical protein